MSGIVQKAGRIADARAARWRQTIAAEAEAMGGITAEVERDRVVIEGRGLLDRWIRDAALRNIGRTAT